jgi:hypothetical protein
MTGSQLLYYYRSNDLKLQGGMTALLHARTHTHMFGKHWNSSHPTKSCFTDSSTRWVEIDTFFHSSSNLKSITKVGYSGTWTKHAMASKLPHAGLCSDFQDAGGSRFTVPGWQSGSQYKIVCVIKIIRSLHMQIWVPFISVGILGCWPEENGMQTFSFVMIHSHFKAYCMVGYKHFHL